LAVLLHNIGDTLRVLERYEEAIATEEEALAHVERTLGPDHPWAATMRTSLGRAELGLGRFDAAQRTLDEAYRIRVKALGPESPSLALIALEQVRLALARGEPDENEARSMLKLASLEGVPSAKLNEAQFLLAQTLWPEPDANVRPQSRAEAHMLASKALKIEPNPSKKALEDWLVERSYGVNSGE
jgi:tetratricopeptide (TPR) repeat protein